MPVSAARTAISLVLRFSEPFLRPEFGLGPPLGILVYFGLLWFSFWLFGAGCANYMIFW
jgi:hypothetical protein